MYVSIKQLAESVDALASVHPFFGIAFLAFKKADLPIGYVQAFNFSSLMETILQQYYRASPRFEGFYSPFMTSSRDKRWLSARYGSTSLQRIVSDTFADAFIHTKGDSGWGWEKKYVKVLSKHLGSKPIPAFHLAAWLYRDENLAKATTKTSLIAKFFKEFSISPAEQSDLFDSEAPGPSSGWLIATKPSEEEMFTLLGNPPGHRPLGASLVQLKLKSVGPGRSLTYEPGERLNLITGDNSLGKTFLLDIIWWALTDDWFQYPALPQDDKRSHSPEIAFTTGLSNRHRAVTAGFNWDSQKWKLNRDRGALPGLVIYARHDGSFAIWDAGRALLHEGYNNDIGSSGAVKMTANEVWNGSQNRNRHGEYWDCNGLLADWITWQESDRFRSHFEALSGCLKELSPDRDAPLRPGKPARKLILGSKEIPTLALPYGDIPLPIVSAGIQRILAIAYILVWSWYEHLIYAEEGRREPQRHIIILLDEIEAHLHPRWQRMIVPALVNVITRLSSQVSSQLHIATHSPMVMASAEMCFDVETDALFHLKLIREGTEQDVELEKVPFVRYGTSDRWLISDIFGLEQARSVDGEQAIERATKLQEQTSPKSDEIADVHQELIGALADDDPYWPRWLFFASEHGVEL